MNEAWILLKELRVNLELKQKQAQSEMNANTEGVKPWTLALQYAYDLGQRNLTTELLTVISRWECTL